MRDVSKKFRRFTFTYQQNRYRKIEKIGKIENQNRRKSRGQDLLIEHRCHPPPPPPSLSLSKVYLYSSLVALPRYTQRQHAPVMALVSVLAFSFRPARIVCASPAFWAAVGRESGDGESEKEAIVALLCGCFFLSSLSGVG